MFERLWAQSKSLGWAWLVLILLFASSLISCTRETAFTSSTSSIPTINTSTTSTTSANSGPSAVSFVMTNTAASNTGSFKTAPTNGTALSHGSGHAATTVFATDKSTVYASGDDDDSLSTYYYTQTSWPKWIKRFEIGISGANNTGATKDECMRFTQASESAGTNCSFYDLDTASVIDTNCSAPTGYLRVSEVDCVDPAETINDGTGTSLNDGVFLRTEFNRDYISASENIMVAIEYAAFQAKAPAANPNGCLTSGFLSATQSGCSTFSWLAYLKSNIDSAAANPLLMLVPPATFNLGGDVRTGLQTQQFFLPMASDSSLKYLHISRKTGVPDTADIYDNTNVNVNFRTACQDSALNSGNSPGCNGMIFYSVSFYKM